MKVPWWSSSRAWRLWQRVDVRAIQMGLPWFGNFENWPANLPIERWSDNVTSTPPLLEQYSVPDFRIGYETLHNIYLQVEEE